ncbi:MAG TPA: ABC transporter permease [Thermoplasmata archaeon]|nr:ABC transporter permease [Thermoplasmata archaeon]
MDRHWRSFKWAAWLGWQIESNWTEPWLFAIYSVIKPVAGAFILVLMYVVFAAIGSGGNFTDPTGLARFNFIYIGNAFFIFVGNTLFGTFQVIQSDREWYQTLRYLYISPMSYYTYIVGRAATKVLVATFAVLITLSFGVLFLHVQVDLTLVEVPAFVAALILGALTLVGIGVSLAALSFVTARHVRGLAEGVPGIFYLFCGVLFPLSVLPAWGQTVGKAIPLTYWFEILRRLLMPQSMRDLISSVAPTTLEAFGLGEVLLMLLVSALLFFMISLGLFRLMEWLARRSGKLDMTTAY